MRAVSRIRQSTHQYYLELQDSKDNKWKIYKVFYTLPAAILAQRQYRKDGEELVDEAE